MNTLLSKSWQYTLYEKEGNLFLEVVCGTVAVFTITIQLNEEEKENYTSIGESYIDVLASEIAYSPNGFEDRNIGSV